MAQTELKDLVAEPAQPPAEVGGDLSIVRVGRVSSAPRLVVAPELGRRFDLNPNLIRLNPGRLVAHLDNAKGL